MQGLTEDLKSAIMLCLLEHMAKTYIDGNYRKFVDSDMFVHRWVAEKFVVKRNLKPGEVVHHKNRNKLDNRPSNLFVCWNRSIHAELHKRDGDWFTY